MKNTYKIIFCLIFFWLLQPNYDLFSQNKNNINISLSLNDGKLKLFKVTDSDGAEKILANKPLENFALESNELNIKYPSKINLEKIGWLKVLFRDTVTHKLDSVTHKLDPSKNLSFFTHKQEADSNKFIINLSKIEKINNIIIDHFDFLIQQAEGISSFNLLGISSTRNNGKDKKNGDEKNNDNPDSSVLIPTKEECQERIKRLYPGFIPGQPSQRGDTILVFFDKELVLLPGTVLPSCNKAGLYYTYYVLGFAEENVSLALRVDAEIAPQIDLVIFTGLDAESQAGGESARPNVNILSRATVGPITGTVTFKATLDRAPAIANATAVTRSFRINDCDAGYHVGLFLGVLRSSLSLPTNIAVYERPNNGGRTLVADNPKDQLALSLMAVFYPTPRRYFYKYRELDFWDKWNLNFGTKLSQNLFDDFFLGTSYEAAKGISLSTGVHYGQHRVIVGYDKFDFGKTLYNELTYVEATNSRQRWDLAWYIGVNLDLRIVGALRGRSGELDAGRRGPTSTPASPPAQAGK